MVNVLFDTNILIDYLNGFTPARREMALYHSSRRHISVITWMEVLVGAQATEAVALQDWLAGFRLISLDESIAERAVHLRRNRKIRLPDAIIQASAQVHSLLLISRNTKDFPAHEPGVRVPYQV